MQFELKPDYDEVRLRYQAFWNQAIIDRPPVSITLPKPNLKPHPRKHYATLEERWLDIDTRVQDAVFCVEDCDYLYDSLPIAWPNLGPNIFSAWCGCGYEFGDSTAWTRPVIRTWDEDFDKARLDMNSPLFKKMVEFTQKLIDRGKGRFIVGLTDFHPGGDHIAALRGSEDLACDLLDEPDAIKRALLRTAPEYFAAYGVFYNMIHSAGMPTTSWTNLINDGTYYIPSNDFSCMVSTKMFEEFFLPGIIEECAFYERSIYHLDGIGALRHLDTLLDIKQLDAVQWVPGAGHEGYDKWVSVYQKIQKAGKSLQMNCHISELDHIFETLKPEGVWFAWINGINNKETAEYAVKRIAQWK